MAPTLYAFDVSPYSRSVLLAAKALGIELDVKTVNLLKGEQMKPEFIAINPQHTIPVLVDGHLTITESRAIITYLASKYGTDDSVYPKDVETRAKIDSLLYFDCSTLCIRWRAVVHPIMKSGATKPSEEALSNLDEALGWLNDMLNAHPNLYLAGTDHYTLADIAITAWLSTYVAAGFPLDKHSNLVAWLDKCKKNIPGYNEVNKPGADTYGTMLKNILKSRE